MIADPAWKENVEAQRVKFLEKRVRACVKRWLEGCGRMGVLSRTLCWETRQWAAGMGSGPAATRQHGGQA